MTNEKQAVAVSNWQGHTQDIYIELLALRKSKQTSPPCALIFAVVGICSDLESCWRRGVTYLNSRALYLLTR